MGITGLSRSYPAIDGRYAVLHNDKLSYLMPWLPDEVEEERNERHQQMFRELARMHTLSSKESPIPVQERKEHYENTLQEWEEQREFLLEYMNTIEKKWYMSPFEQFFCLCFYDVSQALTYSMNKIKTMVRTDEGGRKGSQRHYTWECIHSSFFIQ